MITERCLLMYDMQAFHQCIWISTDSSWEAMWHATIGLSHLFSFNIVAILVHDLTLCSYTLAWVAKPHMFKTI